MWNITTSATTQSIFNNFLYWLNNCFLFNHVLLAIKVHWKIKLFYISICSFVHIKDKLFRNKHSYFTKNIITIYFSKRFYCKIFNNGLFKLFFSFLLWMYKICILSVIVLLLVTLPFFWVMWNIPTLEFLLQTLTTIDNFCILLEN